MRVAREILHDARDGKAVRVVQAHDFAHGFRVSEVFPRHGLRDDRLELSLQRGFRISLEQGDGEYVEQRRLGPVDPVFVKLPVAEPYEPYGPGRPHAHGACDFRETGCQCGARGARRARVVAVDQPEDLRSGFVVRIVGPFVLYVEKRQDACSHTHGKSADVGEGVKFVLEGSSKGNSQIEIKHSRDKLSLEGIVSPVVNYRVSCCLSQILHPEEQVV